MTTQPDHRALRPVKTTSGVLPHPTVDQQLAVERWLASAHRDPKQARREWRGTGMTLLPLGTVFSVVRLPGRLVHAVLGGDSPSRHVDALLDDVVDGGPVFCAPAGHRYYALVPAAMPRTWHQAADDWRQDDVELLGRDTYLGVPAPDRTEYTPGMDAYWSVPVASAGRLCAPLTVARFIAAASQLLSERGDDGALV